MSCHRLQVWTDVWRIVRPVLIALVFLSPLVWVPSAWPSQRKGESRAAMPVANSRNLETSSTSRATNIQGAPDAPGLPFLRLVAVLFSGLVISAAHLARRFRRFWGLGVFANPYAVLFLLFGMAVCGIPATSASSLRSLPYLGPLGPWIADLSGIIAAVALPEIHLKRRAHPARESQVRDLEDASISNPILAVIDDAICDRILVRIQSELVMASRLYDWETIKLAARRVLEGEMVIGRLGQEDGDAALLAVERFQADANLRVDSNNKYTALLGLLRRCPFSLLRDDLTAAAIETKP
jgi:hypothetical protein